MIPGISRIPVVVLAVLAVNATAQVPQPITRFAFSDSPASSAPASTWVSSDLILGSGTSDWTYSNLGANGKSAFFSNDGFNATSETAAVSANDFVAFTVTPDSGLLGLQQVRFETLRTAASGSGAPDRYAVRTSLDGFAASVGNGELELNGTSNTFQLHQTDLSNMQNLQNLTDPIEIRIYFWASQGIGSAPSARQFRIDEIELIAHVWSGVTESFSVGNLDADYSALMALDADENREVTIGNQGFDATHQWSSDPTIQPVLPGLNHALLRGPASPGAVRVSRYEGSSAVGSRQTQFLPPAGATLVVRGLVQIDDPEDLAPGDQVAAGFGGVDSGWNVDVGLHLGVHRTPSGQIFLAALAGGESYLLGSALTGSDFGTAHLIVVALEPGTDGPDRLHAWIAKAGASLLTKVLGPAGIEVETWSSPADVAALKLQSSGETDAESEGIVIDELRLNSRLTWTADARIGPITVTVDPENGMDSGSGTASDPLQSLTVAQDAVRTLIPDMGADIAVDLVSGVHPLDGPLEFGPADSGSNGHRVIYRSRDGIGTAKIRGSRRLTGWTQHDGAIWKVSVDPGWEFHTLYENGRRALKARMPNYVFDPIYPAARAPYLETEDGSPAGHTDPLSWLTYRSGDIDPTAWGDITDLRINIFDRAYRDWHRQIYQVTDVDAAARRLTFDNLGDSQEIGADARYFLEDHPAFLDVPGEFYLDRGTSTLYYIPYADAHPDTLEIRAPRMHDLVELQGKDGAPVTELVFEGLDLGETDALSPIGPWWTRNWGMTDHALIRMNLTESIEVRNCRIANSGRHGILMAGGNLNNRIEGCLIEDMGVSGVTISNRLGNGVGQGVNFPNGNHVLTNNRIRNIGQLALYASCIEVHSTSNNEISHSDLLDSGRYAVTMRGNTNGEDQEPLAYTGLPPSAGNHFHHLFISGMCHDGGDAGALHAAGVNLQDGPNINTFEQILIENVMAVPGMDDWEPNAIFLDWRLRTMHQVFRDIQATNIQGLLFRSNRPENRDSATVENLSWEAGFDVSRMETDSIGVTADFPLEFADDRNFPVTISDSGRAVLPSNRVALSATPLLPDALTFTAAPSFSWSVIPIQSVAEYSFEDLPDSSVSTHSASLVEVGAGVTGFGYSGIASSGKSAIFNNVGFFQTTFDGALAFDDYVGFNVDFGGVESEITAIQFYTLRRQSDGVGAPDRFSVRTSADGFASDVASGSLALSPSGNAFERHVLDLRGAANLNSVSGQIEIRIYFWASSGIGSDPDARIFRIDDLSLVVARDSSDGIFSNPFSASPQLTLLQPGSYLATVTSALENWGGQQSTIVGFETYPTSGPVQTYSDWADAMEIPLNRRGYEDDPLAPDVPNFAAYVTGWIPGSNPSTVLRVQRIGNEIELSLPWRDQIEPGAWFRIESSTDLVNWVSTTEFEWASDAMADGRILFRALRSSPAQDFHFYRLRFFH